MQHLIHLLLNPVVLVLFLVLFNYHHLPKRIWKPFAWFFRAIWSPVIKLDKYLFESSKEVKEIKKSRFKKIVSPLGKLFLLVIAFIIYVGDELFITPATKLVNKILESDSMKKTITFIESQNIIVLRIFVGIPFFMMEITGIIAGVLFLSMPFIALAIYLSKFLWVIPFKFIDKIGHDKLSIDPWYSGLKKIAVTAIEAVKNLEVMKNIHNKIVSVKNFVGDSKHNTMLEIKIRKKLLIKVINEIWSLNHLSSELSESSDVDLVFFDAKTTKKLQLLKEYPDNLLIREEVMDYLISEIKIG